MRRSLPLMPLAMALVGCVSEVAPDASDTDARIEAEDAGISLDAAPSDGAADRDAEVSDAVIAPSDRETPDVGFDDAEPQTDASAPPRCAMDGGVLRCSYETVVLSTGILRTRREVHFQRPAFAAPSSGFPLAILFQGSFYSAQGMWESAPADAFGGFHETELAAQLLEAGFVVVTPETKADGSTYWDTNVPPYSFAWGPSEDNELMTQIFAAIDANAFGPVDATHLYAAGISSGGYMTSRMAVSYAGRFRALAISSASYATCSGPICGIPTLPSEHPPTLFLHGESDPVVPIDTMRAYSSALEAASIPSRVVTANVGHEWLASAPSEIVAWFAAN